VFGRRVDTMLERDDYAGRWGEEPEATPEEIEASARIDAQLRADRVKQIRDECSVVILSPNTDNCNQARWRVAKQLGEALGVSLDASASGGDRVSENDTVITGSLSDGNPVTATTFPSSKKNKASRIRMAAADPSVLIFVAEAEVDGSALPSVKALEKWLSHLLFTASSIGDLRQTAICLIVSNCSNLKSSLAKQRFASDKAFQGALETNFPETAQATDPTDFILSLSGELEKAAQTFDPCEVRTIFVESSLASNAVLLTGDDEGSLTQQVLGLLSSIQLARVQEVEAKDLASEIVNVVPRKKEATKTLMPTASQLWASPLVKVAALGAVTAVAALLVMHVLDNADDKSNTK